MKIIEISELQEDLLNRLACGERLNGPETREVLFFLDYVALCRSDDRLNEQVCICNKSK